MLAYDHIYLLSLLVLIPLLILFYWLRLRSRKMALQKFGHTSVVLRLVKDYSRWRPVIKFSLILLAIVSLMLALVNFKLGSTLANTKKQGIDIIIALDISNSMMAQDIQPNRLERAKMAISKLIDQLDEDQIGIVVFAGKPQVMLPITTDYASAKMLTMEVSPGYISSQGTAIGDAIQLSVQSFDKKSKNKKAIILITDGENHEDDALVAAKTAIAEKIKVYTIGMGSEFGSPIPVKGSDGNISYKKDKQGNTVVTKLNENLLKQIANIGSGTYTRATTYDVGLRDILKDLATIEKTAYEARSFTNYIHSFPFLAAMALLLLVVEFFIFERKSKLTRNLDLFGKKHIIK